jgi:L-ribulose-5-phosphate 4-epimerase
LHQFSGSQIPHHFAETLKGAPVLSRWTASPFLSTTINADVKPLSDTLRDKHFLRKHGSNAYYGQPV